MSKPIPRGGGAVMAQRISPLDSLDFFPTPPWATRALMQLVLAGEPLEDQTCWEPAAGEGHMSLVLAERFRTVFASDVHDYGADAGGHPERQQMCHLDGIGSYTGDGQDVIRPTTRFDWIITNPPFTEATAFAERALDECWRGVALLVRFAWLESVERYELFQRFPAATIALFSERVPMHKGHWNPQGSTTTAYAWIVWDRAHSGATRFMHIPPGQRQALTHAADIARFARPKPVEPGAEQAQGALV